MNERLIEIDVRLLILRYGRQDVLRTIAQLGEQTQEELEQQIQTAEKKRSTKRTKPSVMDIVAFECRERPDIGEPLRTLAIAYQNRSLFPQLRDVQRFLDQIGVTSHKPKSREAAIPILFRALGKMSREDLLRLATNNDSPGESDYSLLAREIMRTPARPRRDASELSDKPAKN